MDESANIGQASVVRLLVEPIVNNSELIVTEPANEDEEALQSASNDPSELSDPLNEVHSVDPCSSNRDR